MGGTLHDLSAARPSTPTIRVALDPAEADLLREVDNGARVRWPAAGPGPRRDAEIATSDVEALVNALASTIRLDNPRRDALPGLCGKIQRELDRLREAA